MAGVRIPQLTYKHAYVVTEPLPGIRGTPMVKDHGTVYIKPQGEALQYGGYEMNPHVVSDVSSFRRTLVWIYAFCHMSPIN